MSNSMTNAFKFVVNIQGRNVTFRRGADTITVKMAPSNYFRRIAVVEDVTIEGNEYVVASDSFEGTAISKPRRGDLITDTDFGSASVIEVREMIFASVLIGYRVRTG